MAEFSIEPKRPNTPSGINWTKCLCHIRSEVTGPLSSFTQKSWKTLKASADVRKDFVYTAMADYWDEGPSGGYHRQCYQAYTNKEHLGRIRNKRKLPTEDQPASSSPTIPKRQLSRRTLPGTDIRKCIICQNFKWCKTAAGSRVKETLSLCLTEQASTTLLKAAEAKEDQKMLLCIRHQDLVAMKIKYHRSCYRNYTRKETFEIDDEERKTIDQLSFDQTFEVLASEIQYRVIENSEVLRMSDMLKRYISLLSEAGVDACRYKSQKLKRRMIKKFGEQIEFWHPQNRSQTEIIFSSKVPKGLIVEIGMAFAEQIGEKLPDKNEIIEGSESITIYHAANIIRQLILNINCSLSCPPSLEQIKHFEIPDILYNMLAWVISSDTIHCQEGKVAVPEKVHRQISAIGQDLIHCATNGRIKTPKHIVLPMTVKSLTGSSEVITILNRFGHGLSYSQVEEAETALAEKQVRQQEDSVFLPSICQPNVSGIFCWDNNDILEETLSGQGTTHCTNGIVIQQRVDSCQPGPTLTEHRASQKKRSFTSVATKLLPYKYSMRKGPNFNDFDKNKLLETNNEHVCAIQKDLVWSLLRMPMKKSVFQIHDQQEKQKIPAWTAFNAILRMDDIPREDVIGYCQTIEASPTELSTVYNILHRSLAMADQLGQEDCIVVFDQAIYAKALEVVWQNTHQFQRIVLRLGAFHTTGMFLAIIGKRFAEAGLADVLVESSVIGASSICGVIEGKHYNRAVRTHKIVLEALLRLRWCAFGKWIEGNPDIEVDHLAIISMVERMRQSCTFEAFESFMDMPQLRELLQAYEKYCKIQEGPMKEFWNSYIDMAMLLLQFIRATREGNWQLHVACIRDMLPWVWAYDRINYARYLPVYWTQMQNLEHTHPEAYKLLNNGQFAVQRTSKHGFSKVATDQTIEQTLNRNTKTKGGIIGFSLKRGAVQRWLMTAHERASIVDVCRMMAGLTSETSELHKEATGPRMAKDECDVCNVEDVIQNWINPFEPSDNLVSLSSGIAANEKMRYDLMNAKEQGKASLMKFVQERILTNETDFYASISKLGLQTFANVNKKTTVKVKGKDMIVKADRNLFGRLLVVAQNRKMEMKNVLKHELGPIPWSLASVDGSIYKTTKSSLHGVLEKDVVLMDSCPPATACIIDAFALLQSITRAPDTFGQLAEMLFDAIMGYAGQATRVDFVADQYPDISIKNAERECRKDSGVLLMNLHSSSQACPRQWKKFLSHGPNKSALLNFFQQEWATPKYAEKIKNCTLFVTFGNKCKKLSCLDDLVQSSCVPELQSSQVEADTRIFLHSLHAAQDGHDTVLIRSSDVDVQVLACYMQSHIPAKLVIHAGTHAHTRFINIPDVVNSLGEQICQALPGLHAITGCDTVSAFAGKGKRKAFELLKTRSGEFGHILGKIGCCVPPEKNLFDEIEGFVCSLYGKAGKCVDEVRYILFCQAKNIQSHLLPPTKGSLKQHILRANYQAAVWKHALSADPAIPNPNGQGWFLKEGKLSIHWTDLAPAPDVILELVSCGCNGDCNSKRCRCCTNNLPCSDACRCGDRCKNKVLSLDEGSDDDNDYD